MNLENVDWQEFGFKTEEEYLEYLDYDEEYDKEAEHEDRMLHQILEEKAAKENEES